jgi:chitobiase/beta-hexosaminidase-like protein
MNLDFIEKMPEEIADFLATDPYFTDIADATKNIPVLAFKKKETFSEIQRRIDSIQICALVIISQASVNDPSNGGPFFDEVEVQVGFIDNRIANATGKSAEIAAAYAASVLHGFKPASANGPLVLGDPAYVEIPPETAADKQKRLVAIRLTTSAGVSYAPQVVITPIINEDLGQIVNITSGTPGTTIYYTIDGSNPTVLSTLWAGGPVIVPSGSTAKARAYKAGMRASRIASVIIS